MGLWTASAGLQVDEILRDGIICKSIKEEHLGETHARAEFKNVSSSSENVARACDSASWFGGSINRGW